MLRNFTIYKTRTYSTDGKSNQWETIFHAILANNCFKIFKLDSSYLSTYTKITSRLIRMLNRKKILKILENTRNNYLMSRLEIKYMQKNKE